MNKVIKRICIYGIGGVGGYFGGSMAYNAKAQAESGREIYFTARGQHMEEIKGKGLKLKLPDRELICLPDQCTDDITRIPTPDLILLCTKSYDLENALKDISKVVKEDTVIVPLLNGVDIYSRIRNIIKTGLVLPACVYVASFIEAPGVVRVNGNVGFIVLGRDPEYPDTMPEAVLKTFDSLGISYKWYDNPFPAIWKKYIFLASTALVTAYYDKTTREVYENAEFKNKIEGIIAEIKGVAKYEGIDFDANIVKECSKIAEQLPCEARTSFQRDVGYNKAKNEGDIIAETIINLGKKYNVATPVTNELYTGIMNRLGK
ncbi:MAG: 2-dehydropantoate 2-reductase [Bacillota bacterium]|nr:2-dehydropantoate 2-reductase [Bacillota bacterium]